MTTTAKTHSRQRRLAAVMGFEAATLAAMSLLHITGAIGLGLNSFSSLDAGVAEAVICVVLAYGASRLMRGEPRARAVAIASTSFAILGFAIGIGSTIGGGNAIDIAYHLTMLPLLVLTLRALVRRPPHANGISETYLERSLT